MALDIAQELVDMRRLSISELRSRFAHVFGGTTRPSGSARSRNPLGALLGGLLHCRPCGCAMTPSFATKKGGQRYRYYICVNAHKRGRQVCPSRSIPANEIERFVMAQLGRL